MRILLFMLCFLISSPLLADPGMSSVQAFRQYAVLLKQLKALKDQIQQGKDLIHQGKQMITDSEGHYGFGNIFNSHNDLKRRQWSPKTWDEALENLSGGNSARYKELLNAYQKQNHLLSDKQFSRGASLSILRSYQRMIKENRAAKAQSDLGYEEVDKLSHEVGQLSQKIESAPNTKAALDLNSRLVAELSHISIAQLRMQTIMNHQMAAKTYEDIDAKKREAIFNKLPVEKQK